MSTELDLRASCPLGVADDALSALRDAALSPAETQRLSDHAATCPACAERLARFERVGQLLRGERLPGPGDRLWRDVRATILPGHARSHHHRALSITRGWSGVGALAAVLIVALLFGLVLHSLPSGATTRLTTAPTATAPPKPTATALAPTSTATAFVPCPPGSHALANIRAGGEGALLDTFAGRWGPQGAVADGNMAFGTYTDTGRQKVLVSSVLPASTRVWTVQYFVDTTQQVSLADAAAIAASILPKDAVQQSAAVWSGSDITIGYCSGAMLRAFPSPTYIGTGDNPSLMPDSGLLTVGYLLRADGTVDSVVVGYGCVDAAACARA